MHDARRGEAVKVFLDLLARSPAWIAAGRVRSRSAAFVCAGDQIAWQDLKQGSAKA